MKRKTIILVSFLLVLYIVPSITTSTEQNMTKDFILSSDPWLTGWDYRKAVNITGSAGSGTNYQVRLAVAREIVMENSYEDIRFTDDDEITELAYWMELSTQPFGYFWVNVTDNLDSDRTIYMYYGNVGVSTTSSGEDTFQAFFDKDSTSGWTTSNIAVSTSGDFLRFYNPTAGDAGEAQRWDITTGADFQMMAQLKTVSLGASDQGMFILGDASTSHRFSQHYTPLGASQTTWYYYDGGQESGGTWTEGTEYIFTIQIDEGDSGAGTDYRQYDTSWALQDSVLGEHFPYGTPTDCDGIYLGDASGAATIDMYIRWMAFRKCIDSPPVFASWGIEETAPVLIWELVGKTTVYFHVPFDYWAFDMVLIFLGLAMLILGALYAAYKIQNDPDRDSIAVVLLLFMFGFGLFLGGIGFLGGG